MQDPSPGGQTRRRGPAGRARRGQRAWPTLQGRTLESSPRMRPGTRGPSASPTDSRTPRACIQQTALNPPKLIRSGAPLQKMNKIAETYKDHARFFKVNSSQPAFQGFVSGLGITGVPWFHLYR